MKFNDNDISSKKIKNLELDILTNIYFYQQIVGRDL